MEDYNEEIEEQEEEQEDSGLFEHHRLKVDPGQSALRVDKFLSNQLKNISRSRLQTAADAGCVMVNNIAVKSNYKVKPNDDVVIALDYPRRELKIIPEDIPLDIVYEDDQLIVVNKPAGISGASRPRKLLRHTCKRAGLVFQRFAFVQQRRSTPGLGTPNR